MSKNKSEIKAMASGAGLLTSVWSTLTAAVEVRGGSAEDLHVLSTPKGKEMLEELADKLVAHAKSAEEEHALKVLIHAGKYDWTNDDITAEHFPLEDDDVTDLERLEIIHLNKDLTTEQVVSELDKRGFRPAKLRGLLTYGAKNPEEQRKYVIVALGSGWVNPSGYRHSPCLYRNGGGRGLDLNWHNPQSRWGARDRFLCARK